MQRIQKESKPTTFSTLHLDFKKNLCVFLLLALGFVHFSQLFLSFRLATWFSNFHGLWLTSVKSQPMWYPAVHPAVWLEYLLLAFNGIPLIVLLSTWLPATFPSLPHEGPGHLKTPVQFSNNLIQNVWWLGLLCLYLLRKTNKMWICIIPALVASKASIKAGCWEKFWARKPKNDTFFCLITVKKSFQLLEKGEDILVHWIFCSDNEFDLQSEKIWAKMGPLEHAQATYKYTGTG